MEIPSKNTSSNVPTDFFEYWDSLGFFENLKMMLPREFLIIFEIARNIFTDETSELYSAIEDITSEEIINKPDRDESIKVNRLEKISPLSDKMEIDTYRTIMDLKRALPRELALDDDMFDVKLFTKSLLVQKFYETESDSFKPISTSQDKSGKEANQFEQKFYILLDRSKSMDSKMRIFYSKCIVAEFLRKKRKSKAKLFYRAFDSKVGKLYKIEKQEDFPQLIEKVFLTTTGGTTTNIQDAVYQAIKDINYDKDMVNSEILIVTDGISKIFKGEMKEKLGNIKLNVLKIGKDLAETDFYAMKSALDSENLKFDPTALSVESIQNEVKKYKGGTTNNSTNLTEQRAFHLILEKSEKMFEDLKEISKKYIEIQDLQNDNIFKVTEDNQKKIKDSIDSLSGTDISNFSIDEKVKVLKKLQFLSQYLQVLVDNGNPDNVFLKNSLKRLGEIKEKLLKNPELLLTIVQTEDFDDSKKKMKIAKKDAKKLMKELEMTGKALSMKEMKKAKIMMTFDVSGEGSAGQLFLLIFIKIIQLIKKILLFPVNLFRKEK